MRAAALLVQGAAQVTISGGSFVIVHRPACAALTSAGNTTACPPWSRQLEHRALSLSPVSMFLLHCYVLLLEVREGQQQMPVIPSWGTTITTVNALSSCSLLFYS
eukprot:scpid100257/ scgid32593/ 